MTDDGGGVVVTVAVRGSETSATRARMPLGWLSRCASPDACARIGAASPGTARHLAVRLYESLGRRGRHREADRVFRDAAAADSDVPEGGGGAVAVAERELTGMACLLKDGFVGYLRELAKITPPVPKEMAREIKLQEKIIQISLAASNETLSGKRKRWWRHVQEAISKKKSMTKSSFNDNEELFAAESMQIFSKLMISCSITKNS